MGERHAVNAQHTPTATEANALRSALEGLLGPAEAEIASLEEGGFYEMKSARIKQWTSAVKAARAALAKARGGGAVSTALRAALDATISCLALVEAQAMADGNTALAVDAAAMSDALRRYRAATARSIMMRPCHGCHKLTAIVGLNFGWCLTCRPAMADDGAAFSPDPWAPANAEVEQPMGLSELLFTQGLAMVRRQSGRAPFILPDRDDGAAFDEISRGVER